MSIGKEEIMILERLSKLRLTEAEREKAGEYFSFISNEIKSLEKVNTDNTEPLPFGIELTNIFRDDIDKKDIPREEILKNAPEQRDGYFVVPKTVE